MLLLSQELVKQRLLGDKMGQFGLYGENNGPHLWCWQSFLTFDDVLGYPNNPEFQVVQCLVESHEPDPRGFYTCMCYYICQFC